MIVLDASAAVELLGNAPAGKAILRRVGDERVLHAPHLLDLEVVNAFRRQSAFRGGLEQERVAQALAQYRNLRIIRHPHYIFLDRIWDLHHNFTSYDACYLALAEALNATLLTRDAALASARLHRGKVEVI